MTIEEMHIDFQTKLQEVYAYTFGDLTVEEIDWVLNEHMFKFIEYRTDPKSNRKQEGFEYTQKRYDDIENLVTTTTLPVRDKGGYVSAFLPSNYFKLVNERPLVSCGIYTIANRSLSVVYADLINAAQTTINTYRLSIEIAGTPYVIFDKSDYTSEVISKQHFAAFLALVMNTLSNYKPELITANWENVGNYNKPNKTVIVGYDTSISITVYSTNSAGTVFTSTFDPVNETITTLVPSGNIQEVDGRLTEHEALYRLLNNWFSRTKPNSPICVIEKGELKVYYSAFIVSGVNVTYIKTPRFLNKRLKVDCELGSRTGQRYNICRQIVDAAVASVAGRLSSGNAAILNEHFLTTE